MEQGIRIRTVILLWFFLSGVSGLYAQSCLPDGITFTSQSQIDSFPINYPNCTEIEGDVIFPYPNTVSSLQGLNSISSIGGELLISDCNDITTLEGLNNIQSIGGALSIISNDNLLNLSALQNLRTIGGGLTISWNYRLKSLSGIDSINAESIDALHMIYNDSLSWCAVESVCEYIGSPNASVSIQNAVGCDSLEVVEKFCQQGFSQGWAGIGSIWHYTRGTINPDLISYLTFESVADDTINGILCKRIIEIDPYWGDSTIKTHYMYSSNDSVFFFRDGDFHLLLYFGAVEGDTIELGWYKTGSGDPLLMIVDSTSTIEINGETRVIQYVECGDGLVIEYADEVIEGIGSTFYMFPTLDGEQYGPLRCYEDSVVGLFLSPFHPLHGWNFEDCDEIITGIAEMAIDQSLNTYPNPFTTSAAIEFKLNGNSKVQISIFNTIGEMVYAGEEQMMPQGTHQFSWTPHHLPAGLYYGVLRSEEGVSVVKMVKQ